MKRCQVCYNVTDDKTPTCPRCGEASWMPIAAAKPAPVEAPPPDVATMSDAELEALTAPAPKKGRR